MIKKKKGQSLITSYLVIIVIILFWAVGLAGWVSEAGQEASYHLEPEQGIMKFFVENLNLLIFCVIVLFALSVIHIGVG